MNIDKDQLGYVLVNLLPYREKIKAEKIRRFGLINLLFATLAIGIISLVYSYISLEYSTQNKRNQFIEKENKLLSSQITEIVTLKDEIRDTLEKRSVVESLQTDRSDSVNILNIIANMLPTGTSLESVKQKGNNIEIIGLTQSNNKVSEYMTALESTGFFNNSVLIEIKSIVIADKANKVSDKKKIMNNFENTYSRFNIVMSLNKKLPEIEEDPKNKNKKNKK